MRVLRFQIEKLKKPDVAEPDRQQNAAGRDTGTDHRPFYFFTHVSLRMWLLF
jgi:hypothetical protein